MDLTGVSADAATYQMHSPPPLRQLFRIPRYMGSKRTEMLFIGLEVCYNEPSVGSSTPLMEEAALSSALGSLRPAMSVTMMFMMVQCCSITLISSSVLHLAQKLTYLPNSYEMLLTILPNPGQKWIYYLQIRMRSKPRNLPDWFIFARLFATTLDHMLPVLGRPCGAGCSPPARPESAGGRAEAPPVSPKWSSLVRSFHREPGHPMTTGRPERHRCPGWAFAPRGI